MKVLHVESGRHFYGGAQQVVYLLDGLRRNEVENVLVCHPDSDLGFKARATGAKVYTVPSAGDLDFTFAWSLRRIIRRETPDVVHCHSRRGADFMGGIAAASARIPAVVSRRVDHPESRFVAWWRYRPFRKVIAISDNVATVLKDNGLGRDRLLVIRSAVRSETSSQSREQLLQEFSLPDNAFAIAAAGQLIARKGHRYLLDAMAKLTKTLPRARLVIFGRGKLEAELKAQANRLQLEHYLRFAGFRGDLDRYMGAFDLLVHPALREGLGVSMLKAAAAGVPVVAFDIAGSREAVAHRRSGILVRSKDAAAMEQAILTLANDDTLRQRYGEASRARMQKEFSIETMVGRHVKLYEKLVKDDGSEHKWS